MVYGVKELTDWDYFDSALLLSSVLSLLALYLLYQLLKLLANQKAAFYTVLLMMVWPFGYFLHAYYTEALFLSLICGMMLAILNWRWWAVALLGPLLVLCRPNGSAMGLPIGLFALEELGMFNRERRKVLLSQGIRPFLPLLCFVTMPLALLGWCLYLDHQTGDAFAFMTAQQGWHRKTQWPWQSLWAEGRWTLQLLSFYTVGIALWYLLMARRQRLSLKVMFWVSLLLPLSAGSAISMGRFMGIVFPWFIPLGRWMAGARMGIKVALITALLAAQMWSFYWFLLDHDMGY